MLRKTPIWGPFLAPWGCYRAIVGGLGAILGPSWGLLGPSWRLLGPSGGHVDLVWSLFLALFGLFFGLSGFTLLQKRIFTEKSIFAQPSYVFHRFFNNSRVFAESARLCGKAWKKY